MKLLLTILLFPIIVCLFSVGKAPTATNYYISNSGSDVTGTGTIGNPWATVSKVNTVWAAGTFAPGDSILFERGGSWSGTTLVPAEDGTSGARIVVGAYGAGADPILSGVSTITSWESLGSNLYRSTAAVSTLTSLNKLTIDGVEYAMGRYPNAGTTNGGWLTIDSRTSDSVIFDAATLSSTTNWTGSRIVVRVNAFNIDTSIVEAHSSNRIDFVSSKISSSPPVGYGFFFENDVRTLDQHGEWFYDIVTKKVTIYLSTAPSNYTIKAATLTDLVTLSADDYITFDNISFEYANDDGFDCATSTNIRIQDCAFRFIGDNGIIARGGNNTFTVSGSSFYDIGNNAMDFRGNLVDGTDGPLVTITGNTVRRVGLFPGMGGTSAGVTSQNRYGINATAPSCVIEYNDMDSLGFNGIRFYGNNTIVRYNHVSRYCMTYQDGGGINSYNGAFDSTVYKTGRQVLYNVVHDGVGAAEGTSNSSHIKVYGIYLDDNSSGVEVAYNTVFNNPSWGIHLHNNKNINVHHNTSYNNTGESNSYAQLVLNDDDIHNTKMYNMTVKHNILVARTSTQKTIYLYGSSATTSSVNAMGTVDSNYYARPINDSMIITGRNLGGSVISYSRSSWKAAYNHDDVSPYSPVTFSDVDSTDYYIVFIYNPTASDSTVDLINGASYTTVTGDDYAESVLLPAYTSLVLLRTPDPPDPPTQTIKIYKGTNGKILKSASGKLLKPVSP